MQVFKLCMKILKKNIPVMSIYFGIFIAISIFMMSSYGDSPTSFETSKTNVALFTEEETPIVDGLRQALSENAVFLPLEDDPEQLQDALYHRQVEYILRVPDGFTQAFVSGENPLIEKTAILGSAANVYIDLKIQRYLQMTHLYAAYLPDADLSTIEGYVLEDLSNEATVEFVSNTAAARSDGQMRYHFNYLAYTLMFVLIMGVSILMMTLKDPMIRRRNACAPISVFKTNLQVFLAILLFGLSAWIILVVLSLLFARSEIRYPNTLLFIVNSLIFAGSTAGLSYLISLLLKGRQAITAVANIITLGSCFISGVFVPQELISQSVLRVARILPTYWFVRGNGYIDSLTSWGTNASKEVSLAMSIQLLFAVAFFIAAFLVGKRKSQSAE